VASLRWVDSPVERARWRATLGYRVLPTLSLGVEANLVVEEIGPLVTWFVLTETDRRPGVFLGTSSDRIGSPEGNQAYYVTAAKQAPGWPVSAYATLNYSEWDDGFNVPFGVTVGRTYAVQMMYDGERTHLLAHYLGSRVTASVLWVWLEDLGLAMSVGF